MRHNSELNPVLIDYGNSKRTRIEAPRAKKMSSTLQPKKKFIGTQYPHITPKIVSRKATSSMASDVYSFAYLIIFLCVTANVNFGAHGITYDF